MSHQETRTRPGAPPGLHDLTLAEKAASLMVSYRRWLIRGPLPGCVKYLRVLRAERYLSYLIFERVDFDALVRHTP